MTSATLTNGTAIRRTASAPWPQRAGKRPWRWLSAEYYLERPVRTVLDVGCGEGQWHLILKKLRPGIRYTGVDPSEYAVKRFGRSRNLKLGGFSDLPNLKLAMSYDLIVCSDTLYYVSREELAAGIKEMAARLGRRGVFRGVCERRGADGGHPHHRETGHEFLQEAVSQERAGDVRAALLCGERAARPSHGFGTRGGLVA